MQPSGQVQKFSPVSPCTLSVHCVTPGLNFYSPASPALLKAKPALRVAGPAGHSLLHTTVWVYGISLTSVLGGSCQLRYMEYRPNSMGLIAGGPFILLALGVINVL